MQRTARVIAFAATLLLLFEGTDRLMAPAYRNAIGSFCKSRFLFVGSSHTRAGIDAPLIASRLGEPVAKIGLPGATLRDRRALIEYYIAEFGPPEIIFYEIDLLMFSPTRFVAGAYQQLYPLAGSTFLDRYLRESDEPVNYWLRKLIKPLRFNGEPWVYALRNLAGLEDRGRKGTIEGRADALQESIRRSFPDPRLTVCPDWMEIVEDTLRLARRHGSHIHFLFIPESRLLTRYFDARQVMETLDALRMKYESGLVDLHQEFEDHDNLFLDPDHLNLDGRTAFSLRLAETLRARWTSPTW